jgi:hypothetical protein
LDQQSNQESEVLANCDIHGWSAWQRREKIERQIGKGAKTEEETRQKENKQERSKKRRTKEIRKPKNSLS